MDSVDCQELPVSYATQGRNFPRRQPLGLVAVKALLKILVTTRCCWLALVARPEEHRRRRRKTGDVWGQEFEAPDRLTSLG